MTEAISEFERQNPDIKVLLEPVLYEDKDYRYSVESEAGMAPDVYHVHCNSMQSYFTNGYAKDLTGFVKKEGGSKFLSNWFELPLNTCKYNGKLMAIPGDFMSIVLFYNTNLFKKAGLDPDAPPVTWQDFLETCKKLTIDANTDGVPNQWGFTAVGVSDPGFELRFSPFLWSFGGDYITKDGRHSALNTPETMKGFKFFVDLIKKYKVVPPGALKNTSQDARIQLANQRAAMLLGSGWTIPIVDDINPDLNASEVIKAAPLPSDGQKATSAWVMSSNTKHPNEAWRLIKFITSKEMEHKWFDDNRVLSARKDVTHSPDILEDPFARVIVSQLPNARLVPQIKEWPEIMAIVTNAVQDAVNDIKSPESAILDAHAAVEEILNHME